MVVIERKFLINKEEELGKLLADDRWKYVLEQHKETP